MDEALNQLNSQLAALAGAAVNSNLNYSDSKRFYEYQMRRNLEWMPEYSKVQRDIARSIDEEYWNKYNSPLAQRNSLSNAGLNMAAIAGSGSSLAGSLPEGPSPESPGGMNGVSRTGGYDPLAAIQVSAQKELLSSQSNYYDALAGKVESETGDRGIFTEIQKLNKELLGSNLIGSNLKNAINDLNFQVEYGLKDVRIQSAKRGLDMLDRQIEHIGTEIKKNQVEIARDPLLREKLQQEAALAGAQKAFYQALEKYQKSHTELTDIQVERSYAEYMEEFFDMYETSPGSNQWLTPFSGSGSRRSRMRAATVQSLENAAAKSDYGFPLLQFIDDHPVLHEFRGTVNSVASVGSHVATGVLTRGLFR